MNKWSPMRRWDIGRWWFILWTDFSFWKRWPRRKSYWSGGLTSIQWGPFEIGHDSRADWLADMAAGANRSAPDQESGRSVEREEPDA